GRGRRGERDDGGAGARPRRRGAAERRPRRERRPHDREPHDVGHGAPDEEIERESHPDGRRPRERPRDGAPAEAVCGRLRDERGAERDESCHERAAERRRQRGLEEQPAREIPVPRRQHGEQEEGDGGERSAAHPLLLPARLVRRKRHARPGMAFAPGGGERARVAATAPPSFPARLAMAAIAAAIAWALYLARHGLVLVYVSVLLAVAMSPLVRLVERRALRPIGRFRLPRPLAILVVYLTVLGALVGLGFVLAPPIATQAQAFWAALPGLLDQLQGFLLRHAPTLDLVGTLQATLGQFVGGLFGAVVIVFLTFYLLVESQTLFEEALRFCPAERREEVRAASVEVTRKVSGWLAGHLILGGIMGGTTALVLGLMGIPYFWVLAILSFVGEL